MTTGIQCRSDPNGERCKEAASPHTGLCCGCAERARKAGIEPARLRPLQQIRLDWSAQVDREVGA